MDERVARPAGEDGEQLARALEHRRLLLPPVAIDRPLQQYDRGAKAHILLGDLGHLGERGLPIRGVPRRPVVPADGLKGLAGGVAGLARFHQAIAQFSHFFGDRLVFGRDGIEVDARALGAQLRNRKTIAILRQRGREPIKLKDAHPGRVAELADARLLTHFT